MDILKFITDKGFLILALFVVIIFLYNRIKRKR